MISTGWDACLAKRSVACTPASAVIPQRLPPDILDNWMWARPLHTVESRRWVEGRERLAERAEKSPGIRLVDVADREADMPMQGLMQRAHALTPSLLTVHAYGRRKKAARIKQYRSFKRMAYEIRRSHAGGDPESFYIPGLPLSWE